MNSTSPTPKTIGFIGLGNMGSAMAGHLCNAGYTVLAWARNASTLEALADIPLVAQPSIAALCAGTRLLALNVTNTADVQSLLFRDGGIAQHAQPGSIIVDFSTIDAAAVADIARHLKSRNVDYIDCPVSGGAAGARAATLSMMAGGDLAAFNQIEPMLKHLGKTIRHVGPSGAGQAIKAANQMALCIQLVGIAEAMNYALEQGAELSVVLELLQAGLPASRVLDWAGPHMVKGFTDPVSIEAHLHAKDVRMVADAAKKQGLHLPLLFKTAELLDELVANGPKSQDTSRVFEVVRKHMRA
ncbi:MAG: NAD(P)-dependent oxidoreductase [Limnobacter sp.]|jgi:2-hydroxy-3-oxopropionate reductase|uniref:NAD(P)-dependent oxidoreductase n=1 Tax=unclassified Limnobacter TaxID=2630203 RepID=UPI000C6BF975|nr:MULTISPECIES: NAD(P)-dependent oxidoreductase [unclassified Limnobacter]MAG81239.1 2-hydroxy-3-oxopropionate reductase [Sutterellaceae bacterium]MBT85036.1 2-hydroxy-3-oxopropionate reductase [Sutterellaceae bacterium]MDZ4050120.1 NAD(P)-dependent oxidoreductase [Limnobacter sp.]RZO91784.1 MAG: NAD(P)-dependent oxidoreductase [Limnobacter sp.]HAV74209.1 2-hydroxy-3-oxopropionate reductase [Limnobacter sp.]|tara:strand:+ start:17278 stop:18177 length:900 start_codon:yes stop_codon:yes gene_type:complete